MVLPEVVVPEAPPPDPAHAGDERAQPDPVKAAELMDTAMSAGLDAPQPLWLVECGNFCRASLPCPDLRALTHLKALKLAGAVAAVPGSAELQLEASTPRRCSRTARYPSSAVTSGSSWTMRACSRS